MMSKETGSVETLESTPKIIHFEGFEINKTYTQEIKITNVSNKIQRFQIVPPKSENNVFSFRYSKLGKLSPGISQIVCIEFSPLLYQYHKEFLRVRGEHETIMIPLHAYPVLNTVDFPRSITFEDLPIEDVAKKKTITLKCSIPVQFSYHISISKSHPYFSISPTSGMISAERGTDIVIEFKPLTLGTAVATINLYVDSLNFNPIECIISAKAILGSIESEKIQIASSKMKTYLDASCTILNELFQHPSSLHDDEKTYSQFEKSVEAIHNVKNGSSPILSFKATTAGIGSGAVFDAGSEWIRKKRMKFQQKPINSTKLNNIFEGIHIPDKFNGIQSNVNLILTHQKGKLNPKDLKAAIEKSVLEKKLYESEKSILREMRYKNGTNELNSQSIISEDLLNFQYQPKNDSYNIDSDKVRSLVFSDELQEYESLATNKELRISEIFLGSRLLSDEDLVLINNNREQQYMNELIFRWRRIRNLDYPIRLQIPRSSCVSVIKCANVDFDLLKNDLWSKRMNSLRRFMSLVSLWIIRNRARKRLSMLQLVLRHFNIKSQEDAKEFVSRDYINPLDIKSILSNDESSVNLNSDIVGFDDVSNFIVQVEEPEFVIPPVTEATSIIDTPNIPLENSDTSSNQIIKYAISKPIQSIISTRCTNRSIENFIPFRRKSYDMEREKLNFNPRKQQHFTNIEEALKPFEISEDNRLFSSHVNNHEGSTNFRLSAYNTSTSLAPRKLFRHTYVTRLIL